MESLFSQFKSNTNNNKNDTEIPEDVISDIYLIKPKSNNCEKCKILEKLCLFKNQNSLKSSISIKEDIYNKNLEWYLDKAEFFENFIENDYLDILAPKENDMVALEHIICEDILSYQYKLVYNFVCKFPLKI